MDERQQTIKLMNSAKAAMLRIEKDTLQDIGKAYETARQSILAELTELFERVGDNPTPAQIRHLANDAGLYRAITNRLAQLEDQFGILLFENLDEVTQIAGESVLKEIGLIANAIGVDFYPFIANELMELTIMPAIEQIEGVITTLRTSIITEMRTGLAAGEKFSQLASRILSKSPEANSIFSRGITSAKLMSRRAVNQAGNNARLIFMQEAKEQVPGMKKQIIATFDKRTTRLSIQMHGAIAEVDEPFILKSGPPKPFSRKMMQPPFHWNDRDSMVPYHPIFEETSSLKTADMLEQAKQALADLEK